LVFEFILNARHNPISRMNACRFWVVARKTTTVNLTLRTERSPVTAMRPAGKTLRRLDFSGSEKRA
jgi:hypothetical protein